MWNPLNSLKKAIEKVITNPVRGLGRMVRGDFKKGLNDVTGGAKYWAGLIPGVGIPLAAGLGVAEKASSKEGLQDFGDFAGAAAGGALSGWGAGKLGGAIKSAVGRGAAQTAASQALPQSQALTAMQAPAEIATGYTGQAAGVGGRMANWGSAAARGASKVYEPTAQIARMAEPIARQGGQSMLGGLGSGIRSVLGRAGGAMGDAWSGLSPADKVSLVTQGLGTGLQAYGAYKQGQREDQRWNSLINRQAQMAPLQSLILSRLMENNQRSYF